MKGESLPEPVSYKDLFKAHHIKTPTMPLGVVVPSISKKISIYGTAISEMIRFGRPEARTIFIPKSVLREWKARSEGVSTSDLIIAWLGRQRPGQQLYPLL